MRVLAMIGLLIGQGFGDMTACAAAAIWQFTVGKRILPPPYDLKGTKSRNFKKSRPIPKIWVPSTIKIIY